MRTWQGFRKLSGFGSVSVAAMSGYREILTIQSRPNGAPAQTAKALIGIRHARLKALDQPCHSRELVTGPSSGKVSTLRAMRLRGGPRTRLELASPASKKAGALP